MTDTSFMALCVTCPSFTTVYVKRLVLCVCLCSVTSFCETDCVLSLDPHIQYIFVTSGEPKHDPKSIYTANMTAKGPKNTQQSPKREALFPTAHHSPHKGFPSATNNHHSTTKKLLHCILFFPNGHVEINYISYIAC